MQSSLHIRAEREPAEASSSPSRFDRSFESHQARGELPRLQHRTESVIDHRG